MGKAKQHAYVRRQLKEMQKSLSGHGNKKPTKWIISPDFIVKLDEYNSFWDDKKIDFAEQTIIGIPFEANPDQRKDYVLIVD